MRGVGRDWHGLRQGRLRRLERRRRLRRRRLPLRDDGQRLLERQRGQAAVLRGGHQDRGGGAAELPQESGFLAEARQLW